MLNILLVIFQEQQQPAKTLESLATTESQSDRSDKQGMLVQVMSPCRKASKKSRKKQHTVKIVYW